MADINLQSLFPGPIGAMEQTQALGTLGRKIEEENLSNEKARMANDLQSMLQQNQSYRDAYLAGQTGTQQSLAAKGQADKLNYEQMVRTYGPDTMAKIGKAVSGAMDNVANLAQRVLDSSPTATGADVVATIQQAMPELTQSPQGQKLVQQYSTMDRQSLLQQLQEYNRNRGDFAALADPAYHKQMDVAELKGEYGLAGREITAENQIALAQMKAAFKASAGGSSSTADKFFTKLYTTSPANRRATLVGMLESGMNPVTREQLSQEQLNATAAMVKADTDYLNQKPENIGAGKPTFVTNPVTGKISISTPQARTLEVPAANLPTATGPGGMPIPPTRSPNVANAQQATANVVSQKAGAAASPQLSMSEQLLAAAKAEQARRAAQQK